jgi:cytoskeletal protein CcmA (bactofilin family)
MRKRGRLKPMMRAFRPTCLALAALAWAVGATLSPAISVAQEQFFTQSGGRGLQNAKTNARLTKAETEIGVIQEDLKTIKPHARAELGNCSAEGEKLRFDGVNWICDKETDPTVQAFAKKALPSCSGGTLLGVVGGELGCSQVGFVTQETDPTVQEFAKQPLPQCASEQLITVGPNNTLQCRTDQQGLTTEIDPKVYEFARKDVVSALPNCPVGELLTMVGGRLACRVDQMGLSVEVDPQVQDFARKDNGQPPLVACGVGEILRSATVGGKVVLECVNAGTALGGAVALDDLSDVTTAGQSSGTTLTYSNGQWRALAALGSAANPLLLSQLGDALISSPASDDVLRWDGTRWVNSDDKVGTLTDTNWCRVVGTEMVCDRPPPLTCSSGEVLSWDGTGNTWVCNNAATAIGSAIMLNDLGDVTITTVVAGQAVRFDGTGWVNSTIERILANDTQIIATDTGTDGLLSFATDGLTRMAITNQGRVGIGVMPASPYMLDVSGSIRASGDISGTDFYGRNGFFGGNLTVAGNFNISGSQTIDGVLFANGGIILSGTVGSGSISATNLSATVADIRTLRVTNNQTIAGNLSVSGTSNFSGLLTAGNVSITGAQTVQGNAAFGGDVRIAGNLFVSGSQSLDGVLFANGGINMPGTLTGGSVSSTNLSATVADIRTLRGTNLSYVSASFVNATIAQATLTNVSVTTADFNLLRAAAAVINSATLVNLTATQANLTNISATNADLSNNLRVSGSTWVENLTVRGNLNVSGSQTIDGVLFANGGIALSGTVTSGNISVTNLSASVADIRTLRVTNNQTVGGGVSVTGNVQANRFIGSGASLTDIPASAVTGLQLDRISTTGVSSGANLAMVVADQGTISFTLAGNPGRAYLDSTLGLVAPGVSTTGTVSGTAGYFGILRSPLAVLELVSATNVSVTSLQIGAAGSCVSGTAGGIRYSGSQLSYCNGVSWTTLATVGNPDWYSLTNIPTNVQNVSNGTTLTMQTLSATAVNGLNISGTNGFFTNLSAGSLAANTLSATNISASIGDYSVLRINGVPVNAGSADWYGLTNIPANIANVSNGTTLTMQTLSATAVNGLNISGTNGFFSNLSANAIGANLISVTQVSTSNISLTVGQFGRISGTNISASVGDFSTLRVNGVDITSGGGSSTLAMVTGTYTGNGAASQTITLGFRPRMVVIKGTGAAFTYFPQVVTFDGIPDGNGELRSYDPDNYGVTNSVDITANGFRAIGNANDSAMNFNTRVYNYIAFRDAGVDAGATDRITSSTTAAVIANQSGGTVSFTLGGTAGAAYLHPTLGLVAPGVSTTGPISATAGWITGLLQANRISATNISASVGDFTTLRVGGVPVGSGGVARLASLTDVSLSGLSGGQILRYNGTSWTNVNVQNAISTTTMMVNAPDALNCTTTDGNTRIYYLRARLTASSNEFYYVSPAVNYELYYTSAGNFNGSFGDTTTNCNISLSSIYAAGRAFNFIGGSGTVTPTVDRMISGSSNVVVNSSTGVVSFTQLGTATAYLHPTLGLVALGVSTTGPISATAGWITGLLQANRISATNISASVGDFTTLRVGGVPVGSGGVARLASLTDVSLSNLTGLDILRYNGTSWTNVNVQNAISTTTMDANWPDAIFCSSAGFEIPLHYATRNISTGARIYRYSSAGVNYDITFTSSGDYSSHLNMTGYDCVTNTLSIGELYAAGHAFNFIGGSGTVTPTVDRMISGSSNVVVNSSTGVVSFTQLGTATAYLHPTLGLVALGVSTTGPISATAGWITGLLQANRISATNISASVGDFTTLRVGGVPVGSGGVARLASLTDVSLSNLTGLDILRYNGTSWTNVNVQNAISTTTMVADWPDAIICDGGGQTVTLYRWTETSAGVTTYIWAHHTAFYTITYSAVGAYSSQAGLAAYDCVTNAWSIGDLYTNNRAYNFIGGSGTVTPTVDRMISGSSNIVINSSTGVVSFTQLGTASAYLHPTLGLVAPGVSTTGPISATAAWVTGLLQANRISATNISGTVADFVTLRVNGVNITGGGTPGGTTGQVQINDAGAFNGYAGLVYITATNVLRTNAISTTAISATNVSASALQVGNAGGCNAGTAGMMRFADVGGGVMKLQVCRP